jgi:hypothetical protein
MDIRGMLGRISPDLSRVGGEFGSKRVSPRKRAELRYYASTAASGEKFKSVATL